jgi:1,2-diacylglycerol 3-beta-glucosyltransferase
MTSRLLAGAVLLISVLVAWLAISYTLAARLLQALIGVSMVYVGYLAYRGWRAMRDPLRATTSGAGVATGDATGRPWVSVVVAARDEADVIGGAVADLGRQAYADADGPHFDVLVVDDGSTDGTGGQARAAAAPFADRLQVVRREPGSGPATKAAVLQFAHPYLRGEVIAVIDADARLAPDFLERVMRAWQRDPTAAAIQAQRRALNAATAWLPGAQDDEQLMDMASQCGRWATGGTPELRGNGMFVKRAALEAVGGWDERALTEDLDLSTRLVAAGEHVCLAPEAEVREEALERLGALWQQRLRWAEGSLRRLMERGPRLVTDGRLPLARRVDFVLFVGEFVIPPLFATTAAASLVTVILPRAADWSVPLALVLGYGLGTFMLGLAGAAAHGGRGLGLLGLLGRAGRGALFLSHWLLVVPGALLRIAFGPRTVEFAQTPRVGSSRAR